MKRNDGESQLILVDTAHPGEYDFGNGHLINKGDLKNHLNSYQLEQNQSR